MTKSRFVSRFCHAVILPANEITRIDKASLCNSSAKAGSICLPSGGYQPGIENALWYTIVLLCVCLAIGSGGCGRKGSPKAPEETAPSQVRFFTVTPQATGILLSWEAPLLNAEGKELLDLSGFSVQRNVRIPGEDPDFETVQELKVMPLPPVPTAPGESSQTVKYTYQDTNIEPGKIYEYVIVPYNEDDVEGVPSNLFRVTFSGESSVIESL